MTTVSSAVAVVLLSVVASGQTKPNFSGKWALDAEKTAADDDFGALDRCLPNYSWLVSERTTKAGTFKTFYKKQ